MNYNKDRIGEIRQNNQGYEYEIIGFEDNKFSVRFIKTGYVVENVHTAGVWNNTIKDYLEISVAGVGYLGSPLTPDKRVMYFRWDKMLRRCYDMNNPSYCNYGAKGVYVCDSWLCFANYFNDLPSLPGYDWELIKKGLLDLDKDKLVKGNKVYSPSTCCFLTNGENAKYKVYSIGIKCEAVSPTGEVYVADTLAELARLCGLKNETVKASFYYKDRVNREGWKFREIENENN
jgi:hypothetical protein